jgi:hypothetical protein
VERSDSPELRGMLTVVGHLVQVEDAKAAGKRDGGGS